MVSPHFIEYIEKAHPQHTTWRRWASFVAGCIYCGVPLSIRMSGHTCTNEDCPRRRTELESFREWMKKKGFR